MFAPVIKLALAFAPGVPVAKGDVAWYTTCGLLGLAAAAVLTSCIPATEDIRSVAMITIEEARANLLSFELMLYYECESFDYLNLTTLPMNRGTL